MSNLIKLIEDNFDDVITPDSQISIVRFWAPWCGPCRMVAPIFEKLSEDMGKKAIFGELDIDESPSIAARYGIRSIPTTVVFKNGKPVDALVGVASLSQFKDLVSKALDS
ncbi:thioredoxin [Xenorhabdus szentirmaii]|uniref:Thioredoxin n=2 Tax=Xenorhabdus szentirmaii TaxID=290112 RepID=W1IQ61_9GAMM|nr:MULTISPECIES: thioredoxin [Xenorhabdus]MBD2791532.1 thioredoxin [Xenorhabdus sp. CUL]MBD2800535.1 thioredoxin [Xenorhabdus sp. M]MBD2805264.1 thioredoxin [Xenorhabdus sp. ZM]MBD2821787.1 thioredoxin [Xenorhabdus sp. 42]MBD2824686.1 thioredoxin [Xenorhabdus sp. 5]